MNKEKTEDERTILRRGKFLKLQAQLLFTGIYAYKLRERLSWPEISDIMKKNGYKYGEIGLASIGNNWPACRINYFFALYDVLGIPYPTPKLLVEWEEEIKILQAERKERISRQKAEKAERIARNKVL
jgi:hypothetical protein